MCERTEGKNSKPDILSPTNSANHSDSLAVFQHSQPRPKTLGRTVNAVNELMWRVLKTGEYEKNIKKVKVLSFTVQFMMLK